MYQRILVPIDGSPTAARGLAEAIALARLSGGQIRLLHVVDALPVAVGADAFAGYAADILPQIREGGQLILERARADVAAAGVACDVSLREVVAERVHEVVQEEVARWQADLIVIGTHGRRGVSGCCRAAMRSRSCGPPRCRCCWCAGADG